MKNISCVNLYFNPSLQPFHYRQDLISPNDVTNYLISKLEIIF